MMFVRPHWKRFLPLVAINLVSTAVALSQPYLTKLLIDDALQHGSFRSLVIFALLMAACAALSFGLGILTTWLYTKLSALVLFEMRLTAFRKLQRLSPNYFIRTKAGDIVSRVNNDIGELQKLSSDTILSLPANLLFLAGNAAMMFYFNLGLAAVSLALLPFGIWAMRRYQGRLRSHVQTLREYSSEIGSFLIENILGMRLLVSSNAQERQNEAFRRHNDRFVRGLLSMQVTSFLASALPGAVITLSVAILFLYGGSLVIRNVLTIGGLMAFMAYHGRLLSPVQSLMGSYSALIMGSVSLHRVFELLDSPEDVVESPNARPVSIAHGDVEFDHVSFSYPDRPAALNEVSFRAAANSTCLLVGPSGAGKSTVADLLMRFYDPASGSIRIDGRDLRDLRLHDLRSAVAMVEQIPFFLHASIRENLRYAAPGASDNDCEHAGQLAEIHEFIDSLPARYDTMLGERGLTLSAGQRQRLAIARALLRQPRVLILDEPTAALDPAAEAALAATLVKLSAACTILIVTHRAALVEIADQVIVMDAGRVVETGAPESLHSALTRHFGERAAALA
jgi:ATP-binding cassette subfamily B protein